MIAKTPQKYLMVWHDRREKKRKKRRFSFQIKNVPEKYRATATARAMWAKRQLNLKYRIPVSEIKIDEMYGEVRK